MTISDLHHQLYQSVKTLYLESGNLPFHGWHHVQFVHTKSAVFAKSLNANLELSQIAALVHDLNYLVKKGLYTKAAAGENLRHAMLAQCGASPELITTIEAIVISAELGTANSEISPEAKALSDADTLFKALPITPILFASAFLTETNLDLSTLAAMIVQNQAPLIEQNTYFYSDLAKQTYMHWATTNLQLWQGVNEALTDPDVIALLTEAKTS